MLFLQTESVSDACMAGTFHSYGWVALAVTVAGLLGAIHSLAAGFRWLSEAAEEKERRSKRYAAKSWLLGLWVLVPPGIGSMLNPSFSLRHFGKAECFRSVPICARPSCREDGLFWLRFLSLLSFGREIVGEDR